MVNLAILLFLIFSSNYFLKSQKICSEPKIAKFHDSKQPHKSLKKTNLNWACQAICCSKDITEFISVWVLQCGDGLFYFHNSISLLFIFDLILNSEGYTQNNSYSFTYIQNCVEIIHLNIVTQRERFRLSWEREIIK